MTIKRPEFAIGAIQYDGSLDVATGLNREQVRWKNEEWLWRDLLVKFSKTKRTDETYTEYTSSTRAVQDRIKDVGGLIGGYLIGGKRKAGSVLHRQLLTLDADYAGKDLWKNFKLTFGCAAAIYSTHKHSLESPRLRLVIPVSRELNTDEFKAISRWVADQLGIGSFDHTTSFKPSQIMYWPSTSKDGEFVFDYQDGPWLDADKVLNKYDDWRDSSSWPISPREDSIPKTDMKAQGDPLLKPGIVGAFCRAYDIHQVIEKFLSDVYEPCDVEDRYTFKEGSTSAGLVVYQDKYVYSHHGTDPTNGKLCHAFDLVRLHKFRSKDEHAKESTPITRMPSQLAMEEFAAKDRKVIKQIGIEKIEGLKSDFGEFKIDGSADDIEPINNDWLGEMDVNKKGEYLTTVKNIRLILLNDPELKGCIGFDELSQKMVVLRSLPWEKSKKKSKKIRPWNDDDWGLLRCYLGEHPYNLARTPKTEDVMCYLRVNNTFHPIKDYLNAHRWDGKNRIDTLLIDYLGAKNCEYIRAVTRKTLVAAVARIFQPGEKFDYVLTLIGKQGIGKSTLIKKLGKEWYSDNFNFNMLQSGKTAFEQLVGFWLIEIGELTGFRKAEMDHVKNFLTSVKDTYRPSYGRETVTHERQCIFIGTTNNRDFLRDPSGNRRFWPVDTMVSTPTKSIFKDLTDHEINMLWAEAVQLYKSNEPLTLSPEMEAEANRIQSEHSEYNEHTGIIEKYLNVLLPTNWNTLTPQQRYYYLNEDDELKEVGTIQRDRVCVAEIWCEVFNGALRDLSRLKAKELHEIMRNMEGWREYKTKLRFGEYGIQRGYEREK